MKQPDTQVAMQLAAQPAANRVLPNIQSASRNTGVSFSYLMAQAGKESAFEASAGSRASSAAGLFQFTRNTWLHLVKEHGADHGLGDLASQITKTRKGDFAVHDSKTRQQILDLRRDPQISAMMAGEYARDNKAWLEKHLGRTVDSTELYMAHFLGPAGAARVLKAKAQDPTQPAADLLPQAARKNPSVFYESDHTPRTVAAVYEKIHHAIDRPMKQYAELEPAGDAAAVTQVAQAGPSPVAPASSAPTHAAQRVKAVDQPWPFETGQWPPAYVPTRLQAAAQAQALAQEKAGTADGAAKAAEKDLLVAYTDGSQSADQISSPMPPPPGYSDHASTPLGKLLKHLFG